MEASNAKSHHYSNRKTSRELTHMLEEKIRIEKVKNQKCEARTRKMLKRKIIMLVGENFCDAILKFFEFYYLPPWVNVTVITLISKCCGVERMKDFRPISCCNVIYECISKLLVG